MSSLQRIHRNSEGLSALSQLLQLFLGTGSSRCHLGSLMRIKDPETEQKSRRKLIRHSLSKWKCWDLHGCLFPAWWGTVHLASFKRWVSTITLSWLLYSCLPAGSPALLCSSGQKRSASKPRNSRHFRHSGRLAPVTPPLPTGMEWQYLKNKAGSQNVLLKSKTHFDNKQPPCKSPKM